MNTNKYSFSLTSFQKVLVTILLLSIGVLGAIQPVFYAAIVPITLFFIITKLNLCDLLVSIWWTIVIALFFGAYLSVPGLESIYLFRFLLPMHLVVLLLNQDFKISQLSRYRPYFIFLILYLLTSLISLFWADSIPLGFRYCYFVFEICYLFFLCFYHLDSKKQMKCLTQIITIIFMGSLVLGMFEILTGWHMRLSASNVYITTTSKYQPTGILYNTNDFALFLTILYPVVAHYLLHMKKLRTGIMLYAVATLLTAYVIISTYSRIGMLAFGISAVIIFFYRFRKQGLAIVFMVFPVGFLLLIFTSFGEKMIAIVHSAFTDKSTSTLARENLYTLLFRIAKESNFLGIGAGNVPKKLNALLLGYNDDAADAYTTGHNFWLETLGNIGFIGLLSCGMIFAWFIYQLLGSGYLKFSPTPLLIWMTFIGASIALSTILEKRFLWFILAMGICMLQERLKEDKRSESNRQNKKTNTNYRGW
ncbi:O-antigen ligase family protein [Listeria newyorkensis]|uniref:O-antigen ligase family protein n=1 Tax=Listeria newyorkensis TaxID=1497681 RepID=A0A841YW38_9LIST|nr:O-antigen ligase family protein [Listeria newyorkensis]MBC1457704.1 O-antigen ligase family protein [Listeria newyorkensis]